MLPEDVGEAGGAGGGERRLEMREGGGGVVCQVCAFPGGIDGTLQSLLLLLEDCFDAYLELSLTSFCVFLPPFLKTKRIERPSALMTPNRRFLP